MNGHTFLHLFMNLNASACAIKLSRVAFIRRVRMKIRRKRFLFQGAYKIFMSFIINTVVGAFVTCLTIVWGAHTLRNAMRRAK